MKVICINKCQKNRKVVYEIDKEYDITEEMYKKNKDFFKVKENKVEKKKAE